MRLVAIALATTLASFPCAASGATAMAFECGETRGEQRPADHFAGLWDVLMDVGGRSTFGLMTLALSDAQITGTLALPAGVVSVRSLTASDAAIRLNVASREGEVVFDGVLSPDGLQMCGTVTYHQGRTFAMIARKRADRAGTRPG